VHFCSDRCAERFDANPIRYINATTSAAIQAAKENTATSHAHDEHSDFGQTAIDPVCGMSVEIATAEHTLERSGGATYFCSDDCRAAFIADPDASQIRRGPGAAPETATAHHEGY
jgi:YHS domain-containing protein